MKIRKKFLYIGLVVPIFTIASVAVSCSKNDTEGSKKEEVKNQDTKESLTTEAKSISLDYDNKNNLFTSELSIPDNKSKIKTTGLDSKYKLEITKITQNPGKGTVEVSFKIASQINNVESDEVTYTISGFKSVPIVFDAQKKSVIFDEFTKDISKVHINLQNFDVAIHKGKEPFSWSKPETFEKIGVFNPDYYNVLSAKFEEYKRIFNSPKPTTPATGSSSTATSTATLTLKLIDVKDLPSQYFSFEMLKGLWNKDQEALKSLLNSDFYKLIIDKKANLTQAAKELIAKVPFGVNLTEVITKLVNEENPSIGFHQRSYFIGKDGKDIDFEKNETFQEILRIPANTPTAISGTEWKDFIPFFNVGGEETPDLRDIYNVILAKRNRPVVIKRVGKNDLIFTFFPPKVIPPFVTEPPVVQPATPVANPPASGAVSAAAGSGSETSASSGS